MSVSSSPGAHAASQVLVGGDGADRLRRPDLRRDGHVCHLLRHDRSRGKHDTCNYARTVLRLLLRLVSSMRPSILAPKIFVNTHPSRVVSNGCYVVYSGAFYFPSRHRLHHSLFWFSWFRDGFTTPPAAASMLTNRARAWLGRCWTRSATAGPILTMWISRRGAALWWGCPWSGGSSTTSPSSAPFSEACGTRMFQCETPCCLRAAARARRLHVQTSHTTISRLCLVPHCGQIRVSFDARGEVMDFSSYRFRGSRWWWVSPTDKNDRHPPLLPQGDAFLSC